MKRKKALKAIAKLVARTSKETEWFFGLNQSWIKSSLNETNVSEVSLLSLLILANLAWCCLCSGSS